MLEEIPMRLFKQKVTCCDLLIRVTLGNRNTLVLLMIPNSPQLTFDKYL